MGNYNPHAPQILGQEWVPIRQANFTPDDITERGYTFNLNHAAPIVSGAYYVQSPPVVPGGPRTAELMAIYPVGTEDQTGPIKSLIIPVSGVGVSGTGVTADVADFQNPSDQEVATFQAGLGNFQTLGLSFDVASYSQQLFGKRILDVRLRYIAYGSPTALSTFQVYISRVLNQLDAFPFQQGLEGAIASTDIDNINFVSFTDLNLFWEPGVQPSPQTRVYPWRYQELSNFTTSATVSNRLIVYIVSGITQLTPFFDDVHITYAALEVIYCEEKRVLYAGDLLGGAANSYPATPSHKLTQFRNTDLAIPSSNLAVGEYTVTVSHRPFGLASLGEPIPTLMALRELYQLPHQRGAEVHTSLVVDDTFTIDETPILPHLTLHTSSAVVTGSHAYGTQNDVPVYGTITATQEIEDDPVPAAAVFPQVRFYARRFGDTTVPLTLVDVATGLSTVSISVADFDALPEIVDGWREVNLRFATAPTFAVAAGDVDWRWSATGETAGNQWQVLGVDGPGTTMHSIGPATYYAPNGSTVALTWQSPPISGLAEDSLSDAVLIFSQDPMPVSGFALTIEEQEVDTALECDRLNGCIASAISYVNLTWNAQTFLPVTGFGQYELERFDDVTGEWQLIMSATSQSITGFTDYEARVGVLSTYRIRTCNVLDFCGPWVTGTATVPTPGVTVGGDGNSVLIFTSNENPDANLAYTMSWDGQPIETFAFPEADEVQLQRMFNRDFRIAFHPLERGGDEFSRSIVVNAAAIALPSLANFRGLRDLAWAHLNYVCVRDELGNRWFANVTVPDGVVRGDRTIYVAQIRVAETTDTPTPVDPAEA